METKIPQIESEEQNQPKRKRKRVCLPASTLDRVDEIAQETGMTVSETVIVAVEKLHRERVAA